MIRPKAGVSVFQLEEAREEQSGSAEEGEAKSDLNDGQGAAQSILPARDAAVACFQGAGEFRFRNLKRGREAEENAG
ncbi:MAG: hypothetical protein ACREH9_11315, partial [Pseudomonadota bacterium]